MKGIILERRGDEAALLCEDGSFVNRRVSGAVGETVELSEKTVAFPSKRRSRWMRSAVAALLALTITGGTLGYMGGTASAYVSIDVEDSAIELEVNHFGRVIAVNALSDDAQELADDLKGEVRHHRADDALNITMDHLRERGYFDREDAPVIAGVTSDNANRQKELKHSVENAVGEERELYVSEASRAERKQAMDERISAGRFGYARDHGGKFPEDKTSAEASAPQEAPAKAPREESKQPPEETARDEAPSAGAPRGEPMQPPEDAAQPPRGGEPIPGGEPPLQNDPPAAEAKKPASP